nr:MAG TPA: hypothetical protein [Caudoviricetes sp.]
MRRRCLRLTRRRAVCKRSIARVFIRRRSEACWLCTAGALRRARVG